MHFDGQIRDGRLKLYDEDLFKEHIRRYEGKPIRLSIARGNKRTNQQNRFWWGVIIPRVMQGLTDLGNQDIDEDIVHDFLCGRFLEKRKFSLTDKQTGEMEEIELSGRSSTLSTTDFNELIEKVQIWAVQTLSVEIPDPVSPEDKE